MALESDVRNISIIGWVMAAFQLLHAIALCGCSMQLLTMPSLHCRRLPKSCSRKVLQSVASSIHWILSSQAPADLGPTEVHLQQPGCHSFLCHSFLCHSFLYSCELMSWWEFSIEVAFSADRLADPLFHLISQSWQYCYCLSHSKQDYGVHFYYILNIEILYYYNTRL